MREIILILLLCLNSFAIDKPRDILDSISKYAINLHNGNTNTVYIFVDPMCKHSKKLIKQIYNSKMLHLINTYHIFFYRLPKFESDKLIQYIYQSKNRNKIFLDVMLEKIDIEIDIDLDDFQSNKQTIEDIKKIANVAKKFNMTQRPYMIIFDKNSGYCRVSEGSASCMEEFNFE